MDSKAQVSVKNGTFTSIPMLVVRNETNDGQFQFDRTVHLSAISINAITFNIFEQTEIVVRFGQGANDPHWPVNEKT